MRVLLVYPMIPPGVSGRPSREPGWIPLGLSFVSSALRSKGHEVEIFDRYGLQASKCLSRNEINAAMLERARRFNPDMIGFNTVSPLIHDTLECAAMIRHMTKAPLVAGGHHATALPELTLEKIPQLDMVVAGEGEESLPALADGAALKNVAGLAYRTTDGRVSYNPPRQIEDLDTLPFPALDLLDMGFYLRPGTRTIRGHYLSTISVVTSRGCTRRCDFCCESLTYGKGIRYHSPEYVIEWIDRLISQYDFEAVYFHDNNFLSDKERAVKIFEMLIGRGISQRIKCALQTRADTLTKEILSLMKKAGCVLVEIGVEASAQETLDQYHKGTTVSMNEKAIALCRKAGLSVHAYMLTAVPGETTADMEQRRRWIELARPSSFSWHPLSIYPGTRLYQQYGNGFFEKVTWSEREITGFYSKDFFSKVTPDQRKKWMKRRYKMFADWWMRRTILRVNSTKKIARLLAERTGGRIKKRLSLFLSPRRS